jgi:hypothetical protein
MHLMRMQAESVMFWKNALKCWKVISMSSVLHIPRTLHIRTLIHFTVNQLWKLVDVLTELLYLILQ